MYISITLLQATIGVDFATKTIEYKDNSLKLQIWDSAGQERYKALIPSYVKGASIIFIVYDISNKETFTNVITWINFIKQLNNEESFLVLCGNKNDLQREVTTNEAKVFAEKEKMLFFETSSKTGDGINNMMYTCIIKLPFFDTYNNDNKENLIKELIKINSNNNGKIYDVNNNKSNYQEQKVDSCCNIVLTQENSKTEENKKNCLC